MKGMVFRYFEAFIVENFGQPTWETVIDRTELITQEPFVGPGTYPDADLMALVATAVEETGLELVPAVRAFGKFLFPRLHQMAPMFANDCSSAKEFLASVESAIHVEVKKLYPKSYVPAFVYRDPGPKALVIEYRSKRGLCALVEGMIDGVAEHYSESITYDHVRCTHRGDPCCEFTLAFDEAA